MSLISVVAGTYNRLSLLQSMITSARGSVPVGIRLEFVVVDGGSTDGTQDWCRTQADIALIEHRELRGAIAAFCDGANAASGRYVVLANDDITFVGDSILRALIHLETHPNCGAVAFADNRPSPPYKTAQHYAVMQMPAMRGGKPVAVNYAQVGMFRRWLGDACGWWGDNDPDFAARTYAGDNYLSSRIWEIGYSVDAVDGVQVNDSVHDDALREINGNHKPDGNHPDSDAYFKRYPYGATIPVVPLLESEDTEQLRVLYLPIFEPGHATAKRQKRGLRDALSKRAWVYELDYLNTPQLARALDYAIAVFKPHLILSQIQAPDPLTVTLIRQLRAQNPAVVWVNWNGDVWLDGLTSDKMLEVLRWIDLQLCINVNALPVYQQHGIPAAYWQIGYEEPGDALPEATAHDVVFLANAYDERRKALGQHLNFLRGVNGWSLGLYGSGWDALRNGSTLYDFAAGKAIYKVAKITIGDNLYPDQYGFVSNRLFQAMAAGGAMVLHQHVPGLEELTGLRDGVHYVAWSDLDDLADKIAYYLDHEDERATIAADGAAFCYDYHSFDVRVNELFTKLLPLAKRKPREVVTLRYVGSRRTPFGVPEVGMYTPPQSLVVTPEVAREIMRRQPNLWQQVASEGTW